MLNVASRSECVFDVNRKLFLEYLVKNGGPELRDYEEFVSLVHTLDTKDLHEFREVINPILNVNTLIGRSYTKPFGYPGDFYLIDHIYSNHVNGDKKWLGYRLLIDKAYKGEEIEIWGNPNHKKELVYVKDFVKIVEGSLKTDNNGDIFNVANGFAMPLIFNNFLKGYFFKSNTNINH